MTEHKNYERSTLLLSLVIGLILAVYCLHQRYLHQAMPMGLPKFVAGSFFLGMFGYAAILRVQHPDVGSNFIPATVIVIIALWMYTSWKARKKDLQEQALESETEH